MHPKPPRITSLDCDSVIGWTRTVNIWQNCVQRARSPASWTRSSLTTSRIYMRRSIHSADCHDDERTVTNLSLHRCEATNTSTLSTSGYLLVITVFLHTSTTCYRSGGTVIKKKTRTKATKQRLNSYIGAGQTAALVRQLCYARWRRWLWQSCPIGHGIQVTIEMLLGGCLYIKSRSMWKRLAHYRWSAPNSVPG